MKVLITGANGFLGKACVLAFKKSTAHLITTDKSGNVDYQGDLCDVAFVQSLPEVNAIVHCAAVQYVTKDKPFLFRKHFFYQNNVISTRNLVSRYQDEGTHFIHIGTSMMYKQTGAILYSTNSPLGGEGIYSQSKIRAQDYVNTHLKSSTIIPCIIGGEGREGLFRNFVHLIKQFGTVAFPGKGSYPINMVHISDLANLIVIVAEKSALGWFNAAAPEPLSIQQWIDEIADALNVNNIKKIALPLFPIKIASASLGYRLLAQEQLSMLAMPHVLSIEESLSIGWKPQFNNAQIVREMAAYLSRE